MNLMNVGDTFLLRVINHEKHPIISAIISMKNMIVAKTMLRKKEPGPPNVFWKSLIVLNLQ